MSPEPHYFGFFTSRLSTHLRSRASRFPVQTRAACFRRFLFPWLLLERKEKSFVIERKMPTCLVRFNVVSGSVLFFCCVLNVTLFPEDHVMVTATPSLRVRGQTRFLWGGKFSRDSRGGQESPRVSYLRLNQVRNVAEKENVQRDRNSGYDNVSHDSKNTFPSCLSPKSIRN